jgi:hypothetical protein
MGEQYSKENEIRACGQWLELMNMIVFC